MLRDAEGNLVLLDETQGEHDEAQSGILVLPLLPLIPLKMTMMVIMKMEINLMMTQKMNRKNTQRKEVEEKKQM